MSRAYATTCENLQNPNSFMLKHRGRTVNEFALVRKYARIQNSNVYELTLCYNVWKFTKSERVYAQNPNSVTNERRFSPPDQRGWYIWSHPPPSWLAPAWSVLWSLSPLVWWPGSDHSLLVRTVRQQQQNGARQYFFSSFGGFIIRPRKQGIIRCQKEWQKCMK